jgi:hypothetical protein
MYEDTHCNKIYDTQNLSGDYRNELVIDEIRNNAFQFAISKIFFAGVVNRIRAFVLKSLRRLARTIR